MINPLQSQLDTELVVKRLATKRLESDADKAYDAIVKGDLDAAKIYLNAERWLAENKTGSVK